MLNYGILTNGDCLFHSVEYADKKMVLTTQKGFDKNKIHNLRKKIADQMHKKGYTKISGVPWKKFRDSYEWSQNDVITELSILKNKPIHVTLNNNVALFVPIKANINDTLFIVCQGNVHFTTYKTQPKVNAKLKHILNNTSFQENYDDINIYYFSLNRQLNKSIKRNSPKRRSIKRNSPKRRSIKNSFNVKFEQNKINKAYQDADNFKFARNLQKNENFLFARNLQLQEADNFKFAQNLQKKINREQN